MKLNIIGRQLNVYEETKALIAKKLAKLDKYFPEEEEAVVTLTRKRNVSTVEITISARDTLLRSEMDADDFRDALDSCVAALERQIRKNKTRLAKQLREVPPVVWESTEAEEEDPEFLIRTKEFDLRPMTVEEAILQMNLLGHTFFLFLDADSDKNCVVYTRKDGAYGLIVPKSK